MFGLILLPSGPARTISECAPRRMFCTATSRHHLLLRIHPSQTCFVFRNQCGLTAAKLLGLILCSSCLALSSVLSLSKLTCHDGAKALLWVAPATGGCHQYLPLPLTLWPQAPRPVGSPAQAGHPAALPWSTCGMSPSGASFAGGEPEEVRSPSPARCAPPAPAAAGCLRRVVIRACSH